MADCGLVSIFGCGISAVHAVTLGAAAETAVGPCMEKSIATLGVAFFHSRHSFACRTWAGGWLGPIRKKYPGVGTGTDYCTGDAVGGRATTPKTVVWLAV